MSCLLAVLAVGLMTCTSLAGVIWATGAPGGSTPGGGLDFGSGGGASTFVNVPGVNINQIGNVGDYTIQAWISPDFIPGESFFLGSTDAGVHHALRNGGKLHFAHWGNDFSANTTVPTGPASDPNSWTHALFTYQRASQTATIYFNGVQDGQDTKGPPNNSNGNLIFGSRNNGQNNDSFDGQMDDIGLWNSVLSQAQITALANGANPNNVGNPLGVWGFEEGAGLVTADSTGNGNVGNLPPPPPPPPGGPANWVVTDYYANPGVITQHANHNDFRALLADPDNLSSSSATGNYAVINFGDPQSGAGNTPFGGEVPFVGDTPANDERFGTLVEGIVNIPTSGDWSFIFGTDDTYELVIDGVASGTAGCCGNPNGAGPHTVNLSAGPHDFRVEFGENGGGAYFWFAAAEGNAVPFNANVYRLVGDVDGGGLAVGNIIPEPSSALLAALGLLGLVSGAWRRRKRS